MREPRLQNIPVRSDLGRKLRAALLNQRPSNVIVSSDYASLEKRLLSGVIIRKRSK